ncbi:MAG: tetratricopeptide repeat protein, partial [Gemmatimonadaceae bacterium]|nr:tetratricopeptide repeat protein [Gemmatimonadaceae bacterium]
GQRRHLEQRPVLARVDSRSYRVRKFVRRQRVAVMIATIVTLGLAGFGIVARRQNAKLKRESDRTAAQRDQASAVTHTLWSLLAQLTDSMGRPLSVAEVLDHAEPTIARQYAKEPNVRATMQSALGEIFLSNGDQRRAEQLLREAVASQRADGRNPTDLATRLETLGRLLLRLQQYVGAESAGTEARAIRARLTPDVVDVEASRTLGAALMGQEKYAEAEVMFRELVAEQRKSPQVTPGTSALILLGEDLRRQGRNEEASTLFGEELSRLRARSDADSTEIATALSYLAATQAMMGHREVADSLMQEAYVMLGNTTPIQFQRIGRGSALANRAELAARAGDDMK